MKKIYSFLVLLSMASMSFGQAKNDPAAKAILDAVSAKFKTYKTVSANFTYKVENAAGKILSTKTGSIQMKATKYKVVISGQQIFCNGITVWNYDKGASEVTINKLDNSAGTVTPQKLFTNFYDKDFLYLLNGEKKIGGKRIQEIEMTPVDKSKPFFKVYLQIDKATSTIYSTKVMENVGNRYSYTVTTMKINLPMPESFFNFDKKKYPGVEEIDLR